MIITIDGPAGAGKSTIATLLAKQLGFHMLDTGAMYRAITYSAQQSAIQLASAADLVRHALNCQLEIFEGRLHLQGRPLGSEIRTPEVTNDVHFVADNVQIRQFLVFLQRQFVAQDNFVSEGRDQGTIVFPNSFCKFFLTASPESRARRRQIQLETQGRPAVFDEVLADQIERDYRDENRSVGRLMKAIDAMTIDTDHLTVEQVVERLVEISQVRSTAQCANYST